MNEIITFSNILKTVSTPATLEEAHGIIAKLEETLTQVGERGVGLSAIQIGIPKRIFILKREHPNANKSMFDHFINPEIVEVEEEFVYSGEACLSFPGVSKDTLRHKHYIIKRGLFDGDEFREEVNYFYYSDNEEKPDNDILAIAVQHEMDHLNGKVLPEYGMKTKKLEKNIKVGRNDPCPCGRKQADGTSIKYKKCCGKSTTPSLKA